MPWCPKCKLEYVEGKTICPDCQVELVSSLDEVTNIPEELSYAAIMGQPLDQLDMGEQMEELRIAMSTNMSAATVKYQSAEDSYVENRSGAGVLLFCGILGLGVLLLNYFGIIKIPMAGFSLILTYTVMGCLFFIFVANGIRSAIKAKNLKPLVEKEKENIEAAKAFLSNEMKNFEYKNLKEEGSEVSYLHIYDKAARDLANFLPDAPEGFATYVCDKYLGDILDED